MAVNANWPDYAAYPHRVMINPRNVPGGPWPDRPWLARATVWLAWDDQLMLMRAWCEETLRGPWVLRIGYHEPRIYTQLAEDHAMVQLTWQ